MLQPRATLAHLFCSLSIAVAGRHSLSSVRSTVTTFKLSASHAFQIRFAMISAHQKRRLHFTLMLWVVFFSSNCNHSCPLFCQQHVFWKNGLCQQVSVFFVPLFDEIFLMKIVINRYVPHANGAEDAKRNAGFDFFKRKGRPQEVWVMRSLI
jgi:hypothetical protein